MEKEDEYIQIARKYIPELTEEQAHFVRRIARCKIYGNNDYWPSYDLEKGRTCGCSLCIQVKVYDLKNALK